MKNRQFFLAGLTAVGLLFGCLVRKDEPVAQDKSVGRILDATFSGRSLKKLDAYAKTVSDLANEAGAGGLTIPKFRELASAIVSSGSKGIENFKAASIRKAVDDFGETGYEMRQRLSKKIDNLSTPQKNELDRLAEEDPVAAAALLKRHTDIGDDKIFARLMAQQGRNLDNLAEAVIVNHRVADALKKEFANSMYGLKRHGISTEQISSELKVGSDILGMTLFPAPAKNPLVSYKFLQELSGVDMYNEAAVLDLILRRSNGSTPVSQALSTEDLKKFGNPFSEYFTKSPDYTRPIFYSP